MKRLLVFIAVAASCAFAQEPVDFQASMQVSVNGEGPRYRLQLPEAAYRLARSDLADVRIFNARGEAVPIALAAAPEPKREASPGVELTIFPVSRLETVGEGVAQVRIRASDGTLIAVDGKARKPEQKTVGYVLDASAVKKPLHALSIDWDSSASVVNVCVDGSDDLKSWHPVADPTALVRLEHDGRKLEQARVQLRSSAKYLRLCFSSNAPVLRSVKGQFEERTSPVGLLVKKVSAVKGDKAGDLVYDLGAALPVEAVRLIPAETNSVIPVTLYTRGRAGKAAIAGAGVFYRLSDAGRELQSPFEVIGPHTARYWIAHYDPDKGAVGQQLPALEVQWRPAELVFVARGDAPYRLAFGNREVHSGLQPIANLIPGHEAHAEAALPAATASALVEQRPLGGRWPEWLSDIPPRKLGLWAILIAAVALLGFMAWRLSGELRK